MVNKGLEAASLITRVAAVVFGIICLALVVQELRDVSVTVNILGLTLSGKIKCGLAEDKTEEERCDLVLAAGAISLIAGILLAVVNILALVLNAALSLVVFAGGRRGVFAVVDLVAAIILAILWLATGIFVASEWEDARKNLTDDMKKAGDATVVFSFISAVAWVIVAILAGRIRATADQVLPS